MVVLSFHSELEPDVPSPTKDVVAHLSGAGSEVSAGDGGLTKRTIPSTRYWQH